MRKLASVLIGSLLVASSVRAAVEYEFHQTSKSEIESISGGEISGRGVVDGSRSRIDFLSGSKFPPGTYIIGLDGSRRLMIVVPSRKEYSEVNVLAVAAALGGAFSKIENLKTDMQKLDDHPVLAGLPTDHYRVQTSYDLTVVFGGIPLKQSVNTVIDKWTTQAFGDVGRTYLDAGSLHTGNTEFDKLMDAETSKIKGFPLRQIMAITTSTGDLKPSADSKIQLNPVRRQVSELVVTGVRTSTPSPTFFSVPAGYTKKEYTATEADQSGVHVLSMEPEKKD